MAARSVVTGVSTGIGWGCVKVLTAAGFHVFGSMRKPADAERLTMTVAKPKVRYTVAPNAVQQLMTAVLPKRTMDNLIARRLGLTPPAK